MGQRAWEVRQTVLFTDITRLWALLEEVSIHTAEITEIKVA